jgi:tRNA pseudouridine55 synthase
VVIHAFDLVAVRPPLVEFEARCSSGTYVRTLVHDLGQALGCGAVLERLRRMRSEPFGLDRAVHGDELRAADPALVWRRHAYTLPEALAHLPTLGLEPGQEVEVGMGAAPRVDPGELPLGAGRLSVALRGSSGWIVALGELTRDEGGVRARPHLVFPWGVREGKH